MRSSGNKSANVVLVTMILGMDENVDDRRLSYTTLVRHYSWHYSGIAALLPPATVMYKRTLEVMRDMVTTKL